VDKYDVIHETGSAQRYNASEKGRAATTDDMHRKFHEVWTCQMLSLRDRSRELCDSMLRQIVRDESDVLHYLLPDKLDTLLPIDCDQQRRFHYSTRGLLVTEIHFCRLC